MLDHLIAVETLVTGSQGDAAAGGSGNPRRKSRG